MDDFIPHKSFRFFQQSLFVNKIPAHDTVFGVFTVTCKVTHKTDHSFCFGDLLLGPGQSLQAFQQLLLFCKASCKPCSNFCLPAPGARLLMLLSMAGTSVMGFSLQRSLVISISPAQRIPYLSKRHGWHQSLLPAGEANKPV